MSTPNNGANALNWKLTSADYNFELFIETNNGAPNGLSHLQSCVYWEYARESESLRDPVVWSNLIYRRDDEEQWEARLTPCLTDFFPSTPWQHVPSERQMSFVGFFSDERLMVFKGITEAMFKSGIDPLAKGTPESEKRVFVITRRTLERHGITKITEKIAAELEGFKGDFGSPPVGRGKKFNDYAKRLRFLGYCRLRSTQGQEAADSYLSEIKKKHPLVIRDWDSARRFMDNEFHELFPFIPKDEKALHGKSRILIS